MDAEHFDLVVIGSGPAGEKGAAQAAYHGKRVAIVERAPVVGGTAAGTGGLPSNALRETALYLSGWRKKEVYGLSLELDRHATFERLRLRASEISAVMSEAVMRNIERHNIELFHGRARLGPDHRVHVVSDGAELSLHADVVLVATGSRPFRPPDIPFDGDAVVDSDEILQLDRPFASVVIVGAGPVGCEYASTFAAVGTQVWLVDITERLLPMLDAEIADLVTSSLRQSGIELLLGSRVSHVEREDAAVVVELDGGRTLRAEKLMFGAGRVGNMEGLALEAAGVTVDGRGRIAVDDHYRTSARHVYAAGDVIGLPALASVSMEQARVVMCHAFDIPLKQAVDRLVLFGIFTIPEAAGCLTGSSDDSAVSKL